MANAVPIDPNGKIIDELDINPRITTVAKRTGYTTAWNILKASSNELQQKTGLSANDVDQLMCAVASHIVKPSVLAHNLPCTQGNTSEVNYVSTGCDAIDSILKGGIPFRGITEVTGQSGSGKTQIGLQLALRAQLPKHLGGFGKSVAYICTESQFPAGRLQQMVKALHRKKLVPQKPFTDNLLIHHIPDMDSLSDCVQYQLPVLVKQRGLGLLIIDSVAAVFRVEEAGEDNRNKTLQSMGYRLHKLATTYNVAILAINQMASHRQADIWIIILALFMLVGFMTINTTLIHHIKAILLGHSRIHTSSENNIFTSEERKFHEVQLRQESRILHLQKMCHGVARPSGAKRNVSLHRLSASFLVAQEHSLINCYVNKAGSTAWNAILVHLYKLQEVLEPHEYYQ